MILTAFNMASSVSRSGVPQVRIRLSAIARLLAASSILSSGTAYAQDARTAVDQQPQATAEQAGSTPSAPLATDQSDTAASTADIVVTAQKREQTLANVPMSGTAISGDALVSRGVNNVADLAKLTPGLSFVESGASIPVYSLRGVGFFDTALAARPTVAVYVDQVPLPFSAMTVGAALDLERVEVLKGPQGTLFGANATGGAINYVAAKPTSTQTGGLNVSYGRFNTVDASGFISGPVTDTLRLRVAAKLLRGDDWQYSYTRKDTLGRKDFLQGRVTADWRPSSTLSFELSLNGFRDRSDTQAAQFLALVPLTPAIAPARIPALIGYPVAPENDRAADWDAGKDFRSRNVFYQASLRGDLEISDTVSLTSVTAYQQLRFRQFIDQDGTALTNAQTLQRGKIKSFYQELRLAYDQGGTHGLLGASFQNDKAGENNVYNFPYNTAAFALIAFGPFPGLRQLSDQTFKTYAAFANIDVDLLPQLVAHAGLRYTKADFRYSGCSADINGQDLAGITGLFNLFRSRVGRAPLAPLTPNQCISFNSNYDPVTVAGTLNENNVSWRAGLDWKPQQGVLVYANVSKGYKAGSLPVVNAVFADQLRPIGQESLVAYEVGTKATLIERMLDVTAAAFYYDYSDKQLKGRILTNPNLFGPQEALVNVPKSRIWGLEAQLNVRPLTGLTLSLGGTYLDTKVQSDFSNFTILGTATNFKGQEFPYTPKYQLVFDGDYKRPLTEDLRGFLGSTVNYRSRTVAGFGTSNVLAIDGYTTVDGRIGVESIGGRWTASLFGRNITDTYYWTNVAKIGDIARRLAGQPATYGVQFGIRF